MEAVGGATHKAGTLGAQEHAGRGVPERWPLFGGRVMLAGRALEKKGEVGAPQPALSS